MKFRAVIFDLGGTLYPEGTRASKTNTINQMATVLSVAPVEFGDLWNAGFNKQMNGGLVTCQKYLKNICEKLGTTVSDQQFDSAADIFLDSIKRVIFKPREDAADVLTFVRAGGRKNGLISNAAPYLADIWGKSDLAVLFDVVTFSCSLGIRKPDPRIYFLTIEKLAVKPEECLYVADGKYEELSGASRIGMTVIQLRAPGETDNDAERQRWDGLRVSSLSGILPLLN